MTSASSVLSHLRRPGLLSFVALALLVFSPAPQYLSDMLFAPWVHADPPLLDRWVGRFTAGNGDQLDLVLVLGLTPETEDEGRCFSCNQIEGTAVTCDARGAVRRYRVAGSPRDRQGRQLHIGAIPAQDPPPDGLELDTLSGTWDGADTLTFKADFFWRRGTSGISSTADPATQPVPVRLQRQPLASAPVRPGSPAPACE